MNKFGLACEGITDHIVLENILCGFFDDPELDEHIIEFQPLLDETDLKQKDFGGWELLIHYLQSTRFREDVLNVEYMVVQLDTDIIEHPNFGGTMRDTSGNSLSIDELIKQSIAILIAKIDSVFYETHQEKIIFAVCVHSLECWLYAHHNTKSLAKPKITGCGKGLNFLLKVTGFESSKDVQLYRKYSQYFLHRKTLDRLAIKDDSFNHFFQSLKVLSG